MIARDSYYRESLAAEKLKKCYELAPPRIRRYLKAEIDYISRKIKQTDRVLELGCGYGRIIPYIARRAELVTGIDISHANLLMGEKNLRNIKNCILLEQNATQLGFKDNSFDIVLCVQNGISAFHVDKRKLILESCRVAKPGGTVLFSTYSKKIWPERLNWFKLQADAGLIGEIDYEKTGNGIIICKNGFSATTVDGAEFLSLTDGLTASISINEIEESSLFCEISIH